MNRQAWQTVVLALYVAADVTRWFRAVKGGKNDYGTAKRVKEDITCWLRAANKRIPEYWKCKPSYSITDYNGKAFIDKLPTDFCNIPKRQRKHPSSPQRLFEGTYSHFSRRTFFLSVYKGGNVFERNLSFCVSTCVSSSCFYCLCSRRKTKIYIILSNGFTNNNRKDWKALLDLVILWSYLI